jgi:hypothetical protein
MLICDIDNKGETEIEWKHVVRIQTDPPPLVFHRREFHMAKKIYWIFWLTFVLVLASPKVRSSTDQESTEALPVTADPAQILIAVRDGCHSTTPVHPFDDLGVGLVSGYYYDSKATNQEHVNENQNPTSFTTSVLDHQCHSCTQHSPNPRQRGSTDDRTW